MNIDGVAASPRVADSMRSIALGARIAMHPRAVRRRSAMCTFSWVRWATCALALSIVVPASAERRLRSLADCASFDQVDKDEDKVAFTIHNACTIPVDCAVSWRLVCAPDSKARRTSHSTTAKLAVPDGKSQSTEASAAICGDDAWAIDSVRWSCQPNKG